MRVRIPGVPYCRCRVLSGCVRAGEGCFRLCQLCLGNARIIMIIGRGGGERPVRFGNASGRQQEPPHACRGEAFSPRPPLGQRAHHCLADLTERLLVMPESSTGRCAGAFPALAQLLS